MLFPLGWALFLIVRDGFVRMIQENLDEDRALNQMNHENDLHLTAFREKSPSSLGRR